jgi:hypothetical protein
LVSSAADDSESASFVSLQLIPGGYVAPPDEASDEPAAGAGANAAPEVADRLVITGLPFERLSDIAAWLPAAVATAEEARNPYARGRDHLAEWRRRCDPSW